MSNDIEREAFITAESGDDGYKVVIKCTSIEAMQKAHRAVIGMQAARASSAGAVPEGYALVPETLTAEMQEAWTSAPFGESEDKDFVLAYQAMIAAAPTAPVEGGGAPVPSFWASEAQETEQLIDGRPRKLWWECRPGVGTPYYTHHPHHNGEQGGEWVRCDERLPSHGDRDINNEVWVTDGKDVWTQRYRSVERDAKHHWMPTNLKRPAPPTEREVGHE